MTEFVVGSDSDVPEAIRELAVAAGDEEKEIGVSWLAPTYEGSSPVTEYDVEYAADGDETTSTTITVASTETTLTGLDNGTQYAVRVRARNAVGDGVWSESVEATPGTEPQPVDPVDPVDLEGLAAASTSGVAGAISVSWTPAEGAGSHQISWHQGSAPTDGNYESGPATTDSEDGHSLTGLAQGATYAVKVEALDAHGDVIAMGETTGVTLVTGDASGDEVHEHLVSGEWPDGEPFGIRMRVYAGKPSYRPNTVETGPDGTIAIDSWGSNPRTATFSRPGFGDISLTWSVNGSDEAWTLSGDRLSPPADDAEPPPVIPPPDDPSDPVDLENLQAAPSSNTSGDLAVSWTAHSDAASHQISWDQGTSEPSDGYDHGPVSTDSSSAHTLSASDLSGGQQYQILVEAVDADGNVVASATTSATPLITEDATGTGGATLSGKFPDGEAFSFTVRIYAGMPSYVPQDTIKPSDATLTVDPWTTNPRQATFSRSGFSDITVNWQVSNGVLTWTLSGPRLP